MNEHNQRRKGLFMKREREGSSISRQSQSTPCLIFLEEKKALSTITLPRYPLGAEMRMKGAGIWKAEESDEDGNVMEIAVLLRNAPH